MGKKLKQCQNCKTYTISDDFCHNCKSTEIKSVWPPRFSLDDKYQKYRLPHFIKKMNSLYDTPTPENQ